eukprot:COSAG01_NODE_2309_length_7942_cov_7.425602_7_plen_32_part_00
MKSRSPPAPNDDWSHPATNAETAADRSEART